jgi:hypothetical protein
MDRSVTPPWLREARGTTCAVRRYDGRQSLQRPHIKMSQSALIAGARIRNAGAAIQSSLLRGFER